MRGMLAYGSLFMLGACYVPVAARAFDARSTPFLAIGIAGWGTAVALAAWLRHRHRSARPQRGVAVANRKSNI